MTTPAIDNTHIMSTIQEVAQTVAAAATAIDIIAQSAPVKLFVRARALGAVKARLPWILLPLAGAGLAYLGVRAWRGRRSELHQASDQELNYS